MEEEKLRIREGRKREERKRMVRTLLHEQNDTFSRKFQPDGS